MQVRFFLAIFLILLPDSSWALSPIDLVEAKGQCALFFSNLAKNYSQFIYRRLSRNNGEEIEESMWRLSKAISTGQLSDQERYSQTKLISDLIVKELEKQGFAAKAYQMVNPGHPPAFNSWAVKIVGVSGTGQGPRTLAGAYNNLGAQFHFFPYRQAELPGRLATSIFVRTEESNQKLLILPIESVLEKNVGTGQSVLHEIRHLKSYADLVQGRPGPYHGIFTALPEERGIPLAGYTHNFALDEMATFHRGMRQSSVGIAQNRPILVPSYRSTQYLDASASLSASNNAKLLVSLSRLTISKVTFGVDSQFGKVFADIPIYDRGIKLGTMRYWLVDAQEYSGTQEKVDLLRKYLDTVETRANYHIDEAAKAIEQLH